MNHPNLDIKEKSLVLGPLWVYVNSRNQQFVQMERDDTDEMMSLSIEEAIALRDWLNDALRNPARFANDAAVDGG
jgi:hypothetical protein